MTFRARSATAAAAAVAVAVAVTWLVAGGDFGSGSRRVRIASAPVGGLAQPSAWSPPPLAEGPVANLVLLIGDGLGVGPLAAARLRALGPDERFVLERLPVVGLVAVHPLGGLVPKSDAAATALASGVKTLNGRVGWSADARPLGSLLEAASAAGLVTGLVTSTRIFDATPAAFAAHSPRRHDVEAILDQLAAAPVDLLLGGGVEAFLPAAAGGSRTEGRDRLAEARGRGVTVATDLESLERADRLPLWGLFPGSTLGEAPARPAVGELAELALARLAATADARGTGFFLMIEEEGMDTASHARDLERLAGAALRFDRAVEAAARFAAARGDTLVVAVGDHSSGGVVVDHTSTAERLRVLWGHDQHSGEPVPLFAYGPPTAAARFAGVLDNTEVARRLAAALGLALAAGGDGR